MPFFCIIREVTALAKKRSTEAARGAGPSSEGASAEGGSDGAAARGASDDPPNEQLEGSADDSEACECEGEDDAFQDTVGDEAEASGDPTKDEGDPKPSHGLRGRRPYRHPLELATRIGPFGEFALTLGYGRAVIWVRTRSARDAQLAPLSRQARKREHPCAACGDWTWAVRLCRRVLLALLLALVISPGSSPPAVEGY